MSDVRKELLRQIRLVRSQLDPKAVRALELAKEGRVPYDRDNAHEAVRRFLADRQDGGQFRRRLLQALRQRGDELG